MNSINSKTIFIIFATLAFGGAMLGGCTGDKSEKAITPNGGPEPEWVPPPYVDYVDPFIGSGGIGFGHGSSVVGAIAPFGMVRLSPDSREDSGALPFHHFSGYHYDDNRIIGFSHIHFHGTGATDYGNLLMTALPGFDKTKIDEDNYNSPFRKETEFASPGYYAVTLDNGDIDVELTSTGRTGMHRYTFPDTTTADGAAVIIDAAHMVDTGWTEDISLKIDPASQTVSGSHHAGGGLSGRAGGFHLYWVIVFDRPFSGYGLWQDQTVTDGAIELADADGPAGAFLKFDVSGGGAVVARVGLSWVDEDGARKNLEAESPDFDFDKRREDAAAGWEALLGRVRIAGGSEKQREIFYTSLYHTLVMPTVISDIDGRYPGFDGEIHTADGFNYYTDMSIWDTFRTLHPWLTLVYPEYQSDIIKSMLKMYEQDGFLPIWPAALGDSGAMIGANGEIVIADSFVKGLRDYDVDLAYEAAKKSATEPSPPESSSPGRDYISDYLQYGYVTADSTKTGTSMTLEYAAEDGAMAEFAAAMGKTDDAEIFAGRAKNYLNLWDPETEFFRARYADGRFKSPFDPEKWIESDYVEATAWQYLWYVPHDAAGLIELFGGATSFARKLNDFFELSEQEVEDLNETTAILYRTYYWHGNEPDIHTAYFFNDAGRPDLAGRWLRWIAEINYGDGPDGLPGNDDCGTMSAWYTFSSIGIYPIPGYDKYYVGSPLFSAAEIDMPGDKTFRILAPGADSSENYWTEKATLSTGIIEGGIFRHTDITEGAVLNLKMSGAVR